MIYQYFHWYTPGGGTLWNTIKNDATNLDNKGVTAVWFPPAYKGNAGANDVGYGVYDMYDLGEFNQKGSIATKYGTKQQYLDAIAALHAKGIQSYGDIVMNHKIGADSTEWVNAVTVNSGNRNTVTSATQNIQVWTKFDYPGRANQYSSFKWNASHFDGVDWAQNLSSNAIWRFASKGWDWEVDTENGNYDYLMGADVDFDNAAVDAEYKAWALWYMNTAGLDGLRIDAVKHIKFSWFNGWLDYLRGQKGNFFAVGEYVAGDVNRLNNFITVTGGRMSLFDFPLHYRMVEAGNSSGGYDMRTIFDNTLTAVNPTKSVPFVDNHDTQPLQALASPVAAWFKPIAYALILTRQSGYPMVFWADEFGATYTDGGRTGTIAAVPKLAKIMEVRKKYAYGTQTDYFNDPNIIGWTRQGTTTEPGSGLAALVSDGAGGSKTMYVGTKFAGKTFTDYTGNTAGTVTIGSTGYGTFSVNGGSIALWVPSAAQPTNPTTTIRIVYDTGLGNSMFVRGSLSPLVWTGGAACTWTTGNVWVYTTNLIDAGAPFEFKALINDNRWSDGANFAGTGGQTVTVYPTYNGNFYDVMDNIGVNWAVSGGTTAKKWYQGAGFAAANATSTESQLTQKTAMNKNGTVVTLSFKYKTAMLDAGEYLKVDVLKGTTWTCVGTYTGTKDWTNASIDITAYKSTAMKLRFRSLSNAADEWVYVDNVSVSTR